MPSTANITTATTETVSPNTKTANSHNPNRANSTGGSIGIPPIKELYDLVLPRGTQIPYRGRNAVQEALRMLYRQTLLHQDRDEEVTDRLDGEKVSPGNQASAWFIPLDPKRLIL